MRHVEITIKRESGVIEKVISSNMVLAQPQAKWARDKTISATKAAGKGDIIDFKLVDTGPSAELAAEISKDHEDESVARRVSFAMSR